MISHRLVLRGGSRDADWLLEWDEATFALKAPGGMPVFEIVPAAAHRIIDLYQLHAEGKIAFATPHESLAFEKQPAALAALRQLVELGLAGDREARSQLRRQSLRTIRSGLALFVIGGGPFALYCWYASWAPNPPPGHWIRWFGWLIGGLLFVLMAFGLAGPFAIYLGLRQWLWMRRIERLAAAAH